MKELDNVLFTAQSISASTKSASIEIDEVTSPIAIHAIIASASSLNATLAVEVSNYDSATASDWVTLPDTIQNITADGSYGVDFLTGMKYARLSITITAGSATFTASANSKFQKVRTF